jgi:hypothetical protein
MSAEATPGMPGTPAGTPMPTPLRAAMEARDHAAVVRAMAPDVVLWSPLIEVPFRGIEQAGELYAALLEAFEEIEYTAEMAGDDQHLLAFRIRLTGGEEIEGAELLRFDDEGRVREIRVMIRTLRGLAAFIDAAGPPLARRRLGPRKAALVKGLSMPLSRALRSGGALMPRLLALGRDKN